MSVKLRVFALFTCLILVFVSQKIAGQQTELYRSDLVQYYNALELMGRQHYEPARKAFDAFIREDGDKFTIVLNKISFVLNFMRSNNHSCQESQE